MFRRLPEDKAASVRFTFEDLTVEARQGDSLAAALLAAGIDHFRETPVSGAARGP